MDRIQIKTIADVTIVELDSVLATISEAKPLLDELNNRAKLNSNKLIIDVSCCKYFDSTFIGSLKQTYKKVIENNGQMKLVYPKVVTLKSSRTESITKIIECYNTLTEALNSYISEQKYNFNEVIN